MNKITIFTPTYNREHTLKRLYDSIKNQEYPEFEWIIVDDGSTDKTRELIESFILEDRINIKYFFQENSGKHIAINKGVEEATGNLFYIVDSDDYLTENALKIIDTWEHTIKAEDEYAGIAGLKIFENNSIIGTTFKCKKDYVDATSLEKLNYNITGDKAEVFYTKVLKKYKFPKIDGENFMTEAYVWNKIAHDGLKLRWFNEPIMICEYLEDGLTQNIKNGKIKCPKGKLLFLKDYIEFEDNYIRKIAHYSSFVGIAKTIFSNKEIRKELNINIVSFYFFLIVYKLRNAIGY